MARNATAPSEKRPKKCTGTPEGRLPTLKKIMIELIAETYSTTVEEVAKDIRSLEEAEEALNQFCKVMEEAGY